MRVTRDRITWLLYLQNGLYGWFLYAFGPAVPLLREDEGYSRTVSGLHGTLLATGAVTAGLVQARVMARYGRGRALWVGCAGIVVGALLFCLGPTLVVTLIGAYVAGATGGLVINGVFAALSEHQGPAGPAAITETNALAAAIGTVAPLCLGAGIAIGVGWRPAFLLVVPFALVGWLVLHRVRIPDAIPLPAPEPGGLRRLPRRYWWMWSALICFVGVEFCMTFWGADLVRERTGTDAGSGAAAVAAFLAGVVVGRLTGARLALRRTPQQLLLGSLGVGLAGFLLLWTASSYLVAVAGLLVVGLGSAVLFPLGLARAIGLADGLTDLATGRSGVGVGFASGEFPLVLGALADQVGVRAAFLVVPALVLLGAVGVIASRERSAAVVV